MIRRYVYGKVIETDAVLNKPAAETGAFPFFQVNEEEMSFTYRMADEDIVYGLGQNVRGINKRGWIYESKCSDNMNHHEDTTALYASHNFLIVKGKEELSTNRCHLRAYRLNDFHLRQLRCQLNCNLLHH